MSGIRTLHFIVAGTILSSLLLPGIHYNLYTLGIEQYEPIRILLSHFVFTSGAELLVGVPILLEYRRFQVIYGARKFTSTLCFLALCCSLIHIVLLATQTVDCIATGPYSFIYGLFLPYLRHVPSKPRYKLYNYTLSTRSLYCLLIVQLAFSQGCSSLYAGATGFISGVLFMSPTFLFHRLRLPRFLFSQLSRSSLTQRQPSIESSTPVFEVDNGLVDVLCSMGFTRAESALALAESGNNLEYATNRLLEM